MIHFDKILTILDTENLSPQGCFDKVNRRLESVVLLTMPTEDTVTASFFHEKWGNPIFEESQVSIGLTGFGEKAFPITIETDKVLRSSPEAHLVPSWEEFL